MEFFIDLSPKEHSKTRMWNSRSLETELRSSPEKAACGCAYDNAAPRRSHVTLRSSAQLRTILCTADENCVNFQKVKF